MRNTLATLALVCFFAFWLLACNPQKAQLQAGNASPQTGAATAAADSNQPPVEQQSQPPQPTDAQGFFNKGWEAYRKNHDREAVEAFKEAVRLDPNFAEARFKLGLAYDALNNDEEADKSYEEAVEVYKKHLKKEPNDARAQFFLGLAYGKLGKPEEAVKALKEAARLQPDDHDTQYELGVTYSKLAQYKEAIVAFNKALALDPDDFRTVDALEKAKAGAQRREAFLKQMAKQEEETQKPKKSKNTNANTNSNTNSNTKPTTPNSNTNT